MPMSSSGSDKPDKPDKTDIPDKPKPDTKPSLRHDNVGSSNFRGLNIGSPNSPLRVGSGPGQTTSSSSSSSGSVSSRSKRPVKSHSGELSGSVESSPKSQKNPVPVTLPAGNICPSGRVPKAGLPVKKPSKTEVLGSGKVNYGHGSIVRGGGIGGSSKGGGGGGAPVEEGEEMRRLGNERYKVGQYSEAVGYYDLAIGVSPNNAAYRFNKAMALVGMRRFVEAVREFEEAVRLDKDYFKAHSRLASLFLRLGQVENARRHFCYPGCNPDQNELNKLQAVETKLNKCNKSRKVRNWSIVLKEADAAIAAGADSSPQIYAVKAEAFLKLHQLEAASTSLSNVPKSEESIPSLSQTKFFDILSVAYLLFVRAQFEMAFGRFESAISLSEKALKMDPRNVEISVLVNCLRVVSKCRLRGNDLFNSERYTEACSAYSEGLKVDTSNSVLYCNRAACFYMLGQWENSLRDCNQALSIQPNYTKALLRRAASSAKLERWAEAVRDYEALRRELPQDKQVAENLFHAQVALKKSQGEDVSNMNFGGEVELVSGLDQFRAAISSLGASVVLFQTATNIQCKQISPFLDTLCGRYPLVNFLKVDIEQSQTVAAAENVRIVPTFKIYRNGNRVKEMVCPSPEVLESSVKYYSL